MSRNIILTDIDGEQILPITTSENVFVDENVTLKEKLEGSGSLTRGTHYIKANYTFYQKSIQWFGDSISAGGGSIYDVNMPRVVKTILSTGAISNHSVGSTRFTHGDDKPTIIDKIKETSLTADFVFISGGINDWQSQADLIDFENDLEDMFDYLKSNYKGVVFVITPIPYVLSKIEWSNGYKQSSNKIELCEYRRILEKITLKYNHNLICGDHLDMPNSLGERANKLIPDGLHPSDYGHYVYGMKVAQIIGGTTPSLGNGNFGLKGNPTNEEFFNGYQIFRLFVQFNISTAGSANKKLSDLNPYYDLSWLKPDFGILISSRGYVVNSYDNYVPFNGRYEWNPANEFLQISQNDNGVNVGYDISGPISVYAELEFIKISNSEYE